jgi:hypothetical protein
MAPEVSVDTFEELSRAANLVCSAGDQNWSHQRVKPASLMIFYFILCFVYASFYASL